MAFSLFKGTKMPDYYLINLAIMAWSMSIAPKLAASVSDAESIVRRPDGYYDVKCNDGTRETLSKEQLDAGEVCATGASSTRFQIQCQGHSNFVYPYRARDGLRYGTFMEAENCALVARTAVFQTLCSLAGPDFWYLTRISDGHHLGVRTTRDQCLTSAVYNRQGLACVLKGIDWRLTKVATNDSMGLSVSFDECIDSVKRTREGVVCAAEGANHWVVHRIKDDRRLGFYSSQKDCTFATDNAYQGRVCVNRGGSRWQGIQIATEQNVTDISPLEACVLEL